MRKENQELIGYIPSARFLFSSADSKALSNEKRRALFSAMQRCGEVGYTIVSISSEDLSSRMLRRTPVSLNAISHDTAEQLVRAVLDSGVTLSHVYVDTVGDAGFYQAKLSKLFGNRIPFTVTPKADSLFKCVSAASICAKVTRDDSLVQWRFREPYFASNCLPPQSQPSQPGAPVVVQEPSASGASAAAVSDDEASDDDFVMDKLSQAESDAVQVSSGATGIARVPTHPGTAGSGYPGDPLTKAWLSANFDPVFGWCSVARFSWSTAKVAFKGPSAVRMTWDGEDDDGEEGSAAAAVVDTKQQRLSAFFSAASSRGGSSSAPPPPGRFFLKRGIEPVMAYSDSL